MRTVTVLTACLNWSLSFKDWATDFLLGGVSGAVFKTLTAPIGRVRLVFSNPECQSKDLKRIGAALHRASGIVSLAFTASRAPRPSGESTSRIASDIFRRKPSICPSRIRSR